jgi:hypothetical protein
MVNTWSRRLLLLSAVPLLLVTGLVMMLGGMSIVLALKGSHADTGDALLLTLLLATQLAVWVGIVAFLRQGMEWLTTLPAWARTLYAANALLALVGGLSMAAGAGVFATCVLAWPAILPITHLWIERRRALAASVNPRRTRRVVEWTNALILVSAILAIQWTISGPLWFDRARWESLGSQWDDPLFQRHRMADWLLLTHALEGRTRAEVVALLGEPPPTEYFSEWNMVYNLGAERGFIGIDSEWLVLRLDPKGHVSEAKLVRD